MEAMRDGGRIRIRVSKGRRWRTGVDGVRISVADAGAGMPPEVLRRMREAFFTTKPGTGTGLGIWVVGELLAKHGSALEVRSCTRAGQTGTVVSMVLPVCAPAEAHA
jgi:signal transduction histidine kinase